MKEPMKYIILAAAILCGTAHAAIPGVPRDATTCALAGAIAGAAFELQRQGVPMERTVRVIESQIKAGAQTKVAPPWVRKVAELSWLATSQVPDVPVEWAEARITERCMER